jgi:hypothetical protein
MPVPRRHRTSRAALAASSKDLPVSPFTSRRRTGARPTGRARLKRPAQSNQNDQMGASARKGARTDVGIDPWSACSSAKTLCSAAILQAAELWNLTPDGAAVSAHLGAPFNA